MKVAILGTGPSAAYAALACDQMGVDSQIISNKYPRFVYPGSFWLRENPTDMVIPLTKIYVSRVGTAEKYLEKQWGEARSDWVEKCSFPEHSTYEFGIDPAIFLSIVWNNRNIMMSRSLTDEDIQHIARQYDLVFMTFPTQRSRQIFGHELIRYPIVSYESDTLLSNYCIYDGESYDKMVRMSNLFGYVHCEYSKDYIPSDKLIGAGKVTWAQDTLPDTPEWELEDTPAHNVHLIGRHAQWSRKKLAHHAFHDVIAVLNGENK